MAVDFSKHTATAEEYAQGSVAPYDPAKGREKFLSRIERAEKQATGEVGFQGGSDLKRLHNDVIEYRPTLNGNHIHLSDDHKRDGFFKTTSKKIAGLFKDIKSAIAAGHFDDQIKAALSSKPSGAASNGKGMGGTRTYSEESRLNIRVGGWRRGNKSDADIRAILTAEGVDEAKIKAALAYQAPKK